MSDIKKVILWFLICFLLAVYAKSQGMIPDQISSSGQGQVLGDSK